MSHRLDTSSHPRPGRSGMRAVWTGRYNDGDPIFLDPTIKDPKPGDAAQLHNRRLTGIDVARGLALVGMVSVHTLPSTTDSDAMSPAFWIAAGNAAALFAILAGVGLAFMSGGSNPATGTKLLIARKHLGIRALAIFVIGMGFNQFFSPSVFNILPYYGLLFLLAVPFIGFKIGTLAVWAIGCVIAMPMMLFLINQQRTEDPLGNATFIDLVQAPVHTLNSLFFTGSYPVATWFFYILVGIIIGRLPLKTMAAQGYLAFYGFLTAIGAWMASFIGIWFAGGWENLVSNEPEYTAEELERFITFGGEFDYLPTNTWAWGLLAAPHANTTLSILHSAGIAVCVLGICMLLSRFIARQLSPLALIGSMTLSLYLAHQIYLTSSTIVTSKYGDFFIQLAFGVTLAYVWTRFMHQGPLEWLVAKISKGGDALLESAASGRASVDTSTRLSVEDLIASSRPSSSAP